ncbi:MAG TPA: HAD family phosphatase [Gemmatimonadaceae bacterium]|jgi:HAD superfamily hydrolase (TIGR01509 family)|nr:HAD family phosphatase [Gemmatimonadaceae bacterium]
MIEALLLELEGVMVETRVARLDAVARALADDGIVFPRELLADDVLGMAPADAIARAASAAQAAFDPTGIDLAAMRAERYFAERIGKGVTLRAGIRELLDAAYGRTRLAIVSRARRSTVEYVLGLSGASHVFSAIVCADDVLEQKPAGDGYERALQRLHSRRPLARERALALEDSRAGIRAAHAAGIRCLAVGDLPADHAMEADGMLPDLRGAGADALDEIERCAFKTA